jgi:hypothetical protein
LGEVEENTEEEVKDFIRVNFTVASWRQNPAATDEQPFNFAAIDHRSPV